MTNVVECVPDVVNDDNFVFTIAAVRWPSDTELVTQGGL